LRVAPVPHKEDPIPHSVNVASQPNAEFIDSSRVAHVPDKEDRSPDSVNVASQTHAEFIESLRVGDLSIFEHGAIPAIVIHCRAPSILISSEVLTLTE